MKKIQNRISYQRFTQKKPEGFVMVFKNDEKEIEVHDFNCKHVDLGFFEKNSEDLEKGKKEFYFTTRLQKNVRLNKESYKIKFCPECIENKTSMMTRMNKVMSEL
ncbi:hypothetical protein [Oceanotoga teriensis]|uniref:hypothetical protein n=1 Tax=Oceanotoga teriensis TaxID=515440 RepID=UPI002713E52B|nr:hypothetical protein [Oceanotoga teriensis]MDO7976086.1 hypothetical protein [Oceanotoga teriensis]